MADLVALIVGLAVPALHGIRLLAEDIQKVVGAPGTIDDLRRQLIALHVSIDSLMANVAQEQWEALGAKVLDQAQATITYCNRICTDLHRRIRNWTKSESGKLSWRQRAVIGMFRAHRLQIEVESLKYCRSEMEILVNMATFYKSLQTGKAVDEIKQIFADRQSEVHRVAGASIHQIDEIHAHQARTLRAAPRERRTTMTEDELENVYDDEQAMADFIRLCIATAQMAQNELIPRLKAEWDKWSALQDNSTNAAFGNNTANNGLLIGNNAGQLKGGFNFGSQRKHA